MKFTIDGNASLKDQENTLNFAEKGAPLKLVAYVRGVPAPSAPPAAGATAATPGNTHVNLADFELRPQTLKLPLLTLIEVAAGQNPGAAVPQGKQQVFISDIWVGGVVKKVIGVR